MGVVSWVLSLGYGAGRWEALTSKTIYVLSPIAYKYREGMLKRTLEREGKELEIS